MIQVGVAVNASMLLVVGVAAAVAAVEVAMLIGDPSLVASIPTPLE